MKFLTAIALLSTTALLARPGSLLAQPRPLPAQPAPLPAQPGSLPAQDVASQAPDQALPQTSSITVRSTLVLVPALVKTKAGDLVFTLKANDFLLTDDGVPQPLTLEEDTDNQPIALVVLVETGGNGAPRLAEYQNLDPILDALVGNVPHQVAIVGFDSAPTLLHGFTPNTTFIAHSLNNLDSGDSGAAILDAVTYSVGLLRQQPTTYRRAILLLSETLDHGSHAKLDEALRAISDTNTAIYSVGFSTTGAQLGKEASKLDAEEAGPTKGCFSRDLGTDAEGEPIQPTESRATQNFDCFAELAPPLRLAKLAFIAATNSLRRNVPQTVAKLTGGEYFHYSNVKTLQHDLLTLSNHIPNRYVLSFHPRSPHPGLHAISLTLPDHADFKIDARVSYWADESPTIPAAPQP